MNRTGDMVEFGVDLGGTGNEPSTLSANMARALRILLVDDDEDDIFCVSRATEMTGISCALIGANSAGEAMRILEGMGNPNPAPLPDLLLLDLKMPGLDGFEVLSWLRKRPQFGMLPAFVLSGSMLQEDVEKAYHLGARGYLVKPVEFQDTVQKLRALFAFWANAAFPSSSEGGTALNQT